MKYAQVIKKGQFWVVFVNSELEGMWESEAMAHAQAKKLVPSYMTPADLVHSCYWCQSEI